MPVGPLQLHDGQIGSVTPTTDALPPLPGGAADIVRFFMDVPQWLQVGGFVIGGASALALAVLAWRHRTQILPWLRDLPTAVKATALAIGVAMGAIGAVGGYQVYDFVEHDNRFCTGCHVMAEAYIRFDESPHAELSCKACHAQPKTESARQLYLWVLERPQEVGPHSPVADARCTTCHINQDPEQWPQIAASMGHRVHFESDDPALGELMCVTCHGVSVHEFTPADATCGECHESEANVRLGKMAAVTELHCIACHDFLGDQPTDLPGAPEGMALLPDRAQCQACHSMGALLVEAELDADPHGAVCGACHNPHTQDTPQAAVESCAGCHEGSEDLTIFHTGTHADIHPQCTACHTAHVWRLEGADCLSCHVSVEGEPGRGGPVGMDRVGAGYLHAPLDYRDDPVSYAPAGEGATSTPSPWAFLAIHGAGSLQFESGSGAPRAGSLGEAALALALPGKDTIHTPRPFLHRQHEGLSCIQCHGRADAHGVVTVRTAEDCAACHHDPRRPSSCSDCHSPSDMPGLREVAAPMALSVWDEPRSRDLPFDHDLHAGLDCQACHTGPVMMAVEVACASCHEDHHRPAAECTRCHLPAEPAAHGLEVHLSCTSSGCHAGTPGSAARPTLSRTLCLACHTEQREHEPGLDCQACHMIPDSPPVRRGAANPSPDRGRALA